MELARSYGVALKTLERGIAPLIKDGTLRTERRRGTFVAKPTAALTPAPTTRSLAGAVVAMISRAEPVELNEDATQRFWSPTVLRHLERQLGLRGAQPLFINVEFPARLSRPTLSQALALAQELKADAAVVVNLNDREKWDHPLTEFAKSWKKPLITIFAEPGGVPFPTICYDQERAGFDAATHCLGAGYTSLLMLRPWSIPWLDERIEGARRAVAVSHRPASTLILTEGISSSASIHDFWKRSKNEQSQLLRAMIEPHLQAPAGSLAIIAPTDANAVQVMDHIVAAERRLGPDIGLIGFDDPPLSQSLGLSSLAPPFEDISAAAARLLGEACSGITLPSQTRLSSHLMIRSSTQR